MKHSSIIQGWGNERREFGALSANTLAFQSAHLRLLAGQKGAKTCRYNKVKYIRAYSFCELISLSISFHSQISHIKLFTLTNSPPSLPSLITRALARYIPSLIFCLTFITNLSHSQKPRPASHNLPDPQLHHTDSTSISVDFTSSKHHPLDQR